MSNWSLMVTNIQPKDSGRYSCEVITEMDHVNASGSITVVGAWICLCVRLWVCACVRMCVYVCPCPNTLGCVWDSQDVRTLPKR